MFCGVARQRTEESVDWSEVVSFRSQNNSPIVVVVVVVAGGVSSVAQLECR